MDSILIFFSFLALLCHVKMHRLRRLSFEWIFMCLLSAISATLAVSTKYSGLFTFLLMIGLTLSQYWQRIADRTIETASLYCEAIFYCICYIVVPWLIYLAIFWVHLSILQKAGPHDQIMTSRFQASLEGGLASIIKGQPLEISHGSQITLKHTHGRACWLHSHDHVYPVRYPDKRGSSHQQQVTCYSFKDVFNWWIVKRPDKQDLVVSEPRDVIKNGDIVQLIHGMTGRALNSHDVAAPMSPQNQEVSCYIDYNISMPAQNLWRVEILNPDETDGLWHAVSSRVRLIHVNSSQALKFSGRQLPDWGFHQHEVVTDRIVNQEDCIWNVEEHRFTKSADEKEQQRDLVGAEFVPLSPTRLSFWQKFFELQYKMLSINQENVQNHMYASESPLDWPLLKNGIAYWISPTSNVRPLITVRPFISSKYVK